MSPCRTIDLGNGAFAVACSRGPRKRCSVAGCSAPAERLCDYPLRGAATGRTCDAPLCRKHATSVGPERDYCPPHARAEGSTR